MTAEHPIVAFLNARLDEDEATALAAAGGESHWVVRWVAYEDIGVSRDFDVLDCGIDEVTRHMEHQSPARALREVEAKRAIVAEHGSHTNSRGTYCDTCVAEVGFYGPSPAKAFPCPTLRALASIYSDHSASTPWPGR